MDHGTDVAARDAKRIGAARFSLASAASLALLKFVAGLLSGSLGVLASAADSLADVFMSSVNYFSIRKSRKPADAGHPYGHGKAETLAALFQGIAIGATGAWVIREGILRLIRGDVPESAGVGIAVMLVTAPASWLIARKIRRAGEETESAALVADSVHFRTDVYTNAGILVSLVAYRMTGWAWLDPGVALVVGGFIAVTAGRILFEAVQDLMDRGLPPETVALVERIINDHRPMVVDFHDLRTRRVGSEKHVDFHVVLCRLYSLEDAHRVADHLEMELREALGNAHVVTHIDPCETSCPGLHDCRRILGEIRNLESPEGKRREGADHPNTADRAP
jgi:ferrous-iron efflux pump FieF